MSRRDISYILEKLSLDHRTSLAEKACAYLQAAESNRTIKNHSSHAAICVDIAAKVLGIDVSREALVHISGAANPSTYNSTRQTLSRLLTGESNDTHQKSNDDVTIPSGNVSFRGMRILITNNTIKYLRQLIIRQGSMELEDLVLESLELFFNKWVKALPPAQRSYVVYSDVKWIGAAFWLCAIARSMTVSKNEEIPSTPATPSKGKSKSGAGSGVAAKPAKKIGGRGAKELKESILDTVEHKVTKMELDKTIRLIEQEIGDHLLSLRVSKNGGRDDGASSRGVTPAPLTSTERIPSPSSSVLVDLVIPVRGGASSNGADDQQRKPSVMSSDGQVASAVAGRAGRNRSGANVFETMSTKRQLSNVSMVSDGEGDQAPAATSTKRSLTRTTRQPPIKRTKVDTPPTQLSSADIMGSNTKKGTGKRTLKETAASVLPSSITAPQRRKTGTQTQGMDDMQSVKRSPVAMAKTNLILWSMAEEFLDRARSLCFVATTQPESHPHWRQHHQDLIKSAVKCLVACISVETQAMTQLDKVKSRLRLAQILYEECDNLERCEDEVNNAIPGTESLEIQLRLYDLQMQLYMDSKRFRQAKNTLRMATIEAEKHELHTWVYQFYLTKGKLHFLMDDIAGSLSALGQGAAIAEQRGDFDMKYSLMLSNWDQAMFFLQKLSPHMGLDLYQAPSTGATAPPPPQRPCTSKHLRVYFLVLFIFCMLRSGNVSKALGALSALHSALDETRPRDKDELQGVFKITLESVHYPPTFQNQSHQGEQLPYQPQAATLSLRWMTFSQVYCLTYLLSGLCRKADMTQPMLAQKFLVDGIKIVDRELKANDYASASIFVQNNQRWFSLLMLNMLLHLADVFMIKFEHLAAEETLLKATYWCKVCGKWDMFKWKISLSIGMLMHLSGKVDEALTWYGICMSHQESSHDDPEGYDHKSLALIHAALIYCGDRHFDLLKVKEIQREVKSRYPASTMTPSLICALHILDSWTVEGLIPARQHLQESLRLSTALQNTQLRSLTLLLLGNIYLQTHDDQAEKMLMTGCLHALKTKNQIVASATGSSLKDLYLKTSQGIKASKQAEQNKAVIDAVDQAFQLTLMAPLVTRSTAEHG
ncbi:hypothetical protein BGZ94_001101 [Podila epigama]|nr:hypothetical protein BGZ94_001101 [Podila epigama]